MTVPEAHLVGRIWLKMIRPTVVRRRSATSVRLVTQTWTSASTGSWSVTPVFSPSW
jgi:hypothetical protein